MTTQPSPAKELLTKELLTKELLTKELLTKELLTIRDVAPILGVSEQRVRQLIRRKRLPSVRVFGGRSVRIPRVALVEWLAVQNEQARASVETEEVSLADLFPANQAGPKTLGEAIAGMGEMLALLPIRDHDAELKHFCMGLGLRVPNPTQEG